MDQADFDLIIAGAGGFGQEVLQFARDAVAAGRLHARFKGFVDDVHAAAGLTPGGERVLGGTGDPRPTAADRFIVAVGDPADRETLAHRITARGGRFATVVHPTAYIAPTASIGNGTVIGPFAFVGPYAQLGPHVVVNTHASVGHDCLIGDFATISPHVAVSGHAVVGRSAFLGSGSIVTPKCRLGDQAVVTAGSVVYQDVDVGHVAHGNPAKARAVPAATDSSDTDET